MNPLQSFVLPANGRATPESIARKRKIAEAMMAQGMQTGPIGHWSQGAARMVNALMGGIAANRADRQESEGRKGANDALIRALSGDANVAPSQQDPNGALLGAINDPWQSPQGSAMAMDMWQKQNTPVDPMDAQRKALELQKLQAEVADMENPQPDYRPATPEEKQQYGVSPETPLVITKTGPKVLSDGKTTINNNVGGVPGDGKLRESIDKAEGDLWVEYKKAGAISGSNAQDFAVLDELIGVAPQGPVTGRLAQQFPGFSSAGDAFQSIVKRIAPTLRAPGSGATSDIEYEGMLKSLPALSNNPEGNRLILQIMRQKSQLNVERSNVITKYQTGEIDAATARREIARLDSISIIPPEMAAAIQGIGGGAAQPPAPGSSGVEEWSLDENGNPVRVK